MPRRVSQKAETHILDGDSNGRGGHRFGTGRPGKTEFPRGWSDDKIIKAVESVANDPALSSHLRRDRREEVRGTRDGIDILVVIERGGMEIVTAYPTNTPMNPVP